MAWSTPPTFTAGATLTASQLNVVSGDLAVIGGARTAWAPTWTNFTTTGATITARYRQVDKEVDFFLQVTLGAGSAITGGPISFTLPATLAYANQPFFGNAYDVSVSTTNGYPIAFEAASTTQAFGRVFPGASAAFTNINATSPFTWASGDIFTVSGRYEAA